MKTCLIKYWKLLLLKIRVWARKKQLTDAIKAANILVKTTGRKVMIVDFRGELKVMFKSDFKALWHQSAELKTHSIQQWEASSDKWYQVHDDLQNKYVQC